jgi:hypothetical protein
VYKTFSLTMETVQADREEGLFIMNG